MFDFDSSKLLALIYVATLWLLGYFAARKCRSITESQMKQHFSKHHAQIISRLLFYIILFLFLFSGLKHLGFNLTVLLGAAGLFTVAVSFAAQTAASNLISGIFMLFEQPFKIGDTLEIKEMIGTVESIDLMSTKFKTSDNKLVRIPNESLIKSQITNLSFYKDRVLTLIINVALQTDLAKARSILLEVANANSFVLKNHPIDVLIDAIVDGAIELKLIIWVNEKNIKHIKTQLHEQIKTIFDAQGILLASPQTVYK